MKRCKNCRWYDGDSCERIDQFDPYDPFDAPPTNPDHAYLSIAADDDQGLQVEMKVGPDFGCIKFEEKRDRQCT